MDTVRPKSVLGADPPICYLDFWCGVCVEIGEALMPVFRRGPRWSSPFTLGRIDRSMLAARNRLADLVSAMEKMSIEKADLEAFMVDLDRARNREIEAMGRRKERSAKSSIAPEPSRSGSQEAPAVEGGAADGLKEPPEVRNDIRSAGHQRAIEVSMSASQPTSYDARRCLFCAPSTVSQGDAERSSQPRRIDKSRVRSNEDLMLRAIALVETPGLMHMVILSERSQVLFDLKAGSIPEAAFGLPLAESFLQQIFSLDALKALGDPQRADAFLDRVIGGEVDRRTT